MSYRFKTPTEQFQCSEMIALRVEPSGAGELGNWFKLSQGSDSALISRTAVYAIRMYGGVIGTVSDGRSYPDRIFIIFV